MDDSTSQASSRRQDDVSNHATGEGGKSKRIPFGMDSFDAEAREVFGNNIRLSMAFMDGSAIPPKSEYPEKAMPDEASAIAFRLKQLGQDVTCIMADQLELLVRYDELEGWKSSGARHCVAWMNLELGISPQLGWEYLRVGCKLRTLPITRALFRAGRLTWSIIRLLSRVADPDNEALLCHTALDASVSDVERFCNEYRWKLQADENSSDSENARSLRQINARSFTWKSESNGNTLIRLSLPPEVAQAFLGSVEQSLAQLDESDESMSQRRADAAVLMAENSLQNAGRDMATADRYQVIVSVDSSELGTSPAAASVDSTPKKRAIIQGAGPVATEAVRRIACDCSISTITHSGGEPIDIGRKSRLWPPAMARAIKNRDQHCQYPGCAQTRHLQIHHIQHWADGGSTCVDNSVCLCAHHHTVVHEGGYRIERVNDKSSTLVEQFQRQQATQATTSDVEKLLRNSHESFGLVRELSPSRFRFRVVNPAGQDIRDILEKKNETTPPQKSGFESRSQSHSTRVVYDFSDQWRDSIQKRAPDERPGVAEQAACYFA